MLKKISQIEALQELPEAVIECCEYLWETYPANHKDRIAKHFSTEGKDTIEVARLLNWFRMDCEDYRMDLEDLAGHLEKGEIIDAACMLDEFIWDNKSVSKEARQAHGRVVKLLGCIS